VKVLVKILEKPKNIEKTMVMESTFAQKIMMFATMKLHDVIWFFVHIKNLLSSALKPSMRKVD
jgi:hypothetical protein